MSSLTLTKPAGRGDAIAAPDAIYRIIMGVAYS
jgi:hypothetical protein